MFWALCERVKVYAAAGGSGAYAQRDGPMTARVPRSGTAGACAQEQRLRGRLADLRCRVAFPNGTEVALGALVFGAVGGVLTLPAGHVADVVHDALAEAEGGNPVRSMIDRGTSAANAFDRTGIM